MSVQLEQFRVVGVDVISGEDVSVVIEAASKAAAEVKAEKQNIETTHIVRLKQAGEQPTDDYELFSADAAEALSSRRTESLIEEVASAVPDAPCPAPSCPEPVVSRPEIAPPQEPEFIAALTRPVYTSPVINRDPGNSSPFSAFAFVLMVLAGLSGGAYYVLIHEPNALVANQPDLLFGDDIYAENRAGLDQRQVAPPKTNAFVNKPVRSTRRTTNDNPPQATASSTQQPAADVPALVLQSVVASHQGRFAVINGKLYREGSDLAGCKLLKVADNWVLMERLGEQFVLEIQAAE